MKEAGDLDSRLVKIRRASGTDARSIADLHGRSVLATYSDLPKTVKATEGGASQRVALWANRLQDPVTGRAVFVAHDGDGIVGFVYVGPTADTDDTPGRTGHVYSIHVDPPVWGAGIGKELLKFAVGSLRSTGFEDATLWVVDTNRRARKFYESNGWRLDGARRKEILAVGSGNGDEVSVVRYRLELHETEDR